MPQLWLALEAYTTDRWLYRRNQVAEPAAQELREEKSRVTIGLNQEATEPAAQELREEKSRVMVGLSQEATLRSRYDR